MNTPIECGVKLSRYKEREKRDLIQYKSLVESLYYFTCIRLYILFGVELIDCWKHQWWLTWRLLSEFFVISKIQLIMVYIIHLLTILNLLNIVIVIEAEIWMIKRTPLALCFYGRYRIQLDLKKQPIMTLSTCEEEFVSTTSCISCNLA